MAASITPREHHNGVSRRRSHHDHCAGDLGAIPFQALAPLAFAFR